MGQVSAQTTLEELAAKVSQALEAAGITATLSGGSAVSLYTDNRYQSLDLDFVTGADRKQLVAAMAPLGFRESENPRLFQHPESHWMVEFPPSPLGFGDTLVRHEDVPVLATRYGPLRIITPTQCVMDRLAAYWYHNDPQCWEQAVLVAGGQRINWDEISRWAESEGRRPSEIDRLRARSGS